MGSGVKPTKNFSRKFLENFRPSKRKGKQRFSTDSTGDSILEVQKFSTLQMDALGICFGWLGLDSSGLWGRNDDFAKETQVSQQRKHSPMCPFIFFAQERVALGVDYPSYGGE